MNPVKQMMELLKQGWKHNWKITCGTCNKKISAYRMFQCYECLVWFCNTCASNHFSIKRPNQLGEE